MKKLFLILAFFTTAIGFSQVEITLDATIMEKGSEAPIPFANIGFNNKATGTLSDEDGSFQLKFSDRVITSQDTLVISHLGHTTRKLSTAELFEALENSKTIFLEPLTTALPKASVGDENRKLKIIGYAPDTSEVSLYWKDKRGLGGEIATYIDVREKETRLLELQAQVTNMEADSLLLRVNIYNPVKKLPGENLLEQEIYYTVKGTGRQSINLKPYNIIVNDDIIVSLELIKVFGEGFAFGLGGVQNGKQSYVKLVSQSNWLTKPNMSMSFSLETAVPENAEPSNIRDKPNEILLLWDQSLSLRKRDISKELDLLKRYLKQTDNAIVKVVTFNNTVSDLGTFTTTEAAIKDLEAKLLQVAYNGTTKVPDTVFNTTSDVVLMFTDGNFRDLKTITTTAELFFINSSQEAAQSTMLNLSNLNDGNYIDLNEQTVDLALKALTEYDTQNQKLVKATKGTQSVITGTVTENGTPQQGVVVTIVGTLKQVETDKNGYYEIEATYDDILSYDFITVFPKKVKVEDQSSINVDLVSKYDRLDEVSLSGKAKEEENDDIKTGEVTGTARSTGFAYKTVDKENFPKSAYNFTQLIRISFPGTQIVGEGINTQVITSRGRSSLRQDGNSTGFVVDGVLINGFPFFLDVNAIESISLLPGTVAAIRYGQNARNGVFIVKTLRGDFSEKQPVNRLLVKGNDFSEQVLRYDPNIDKPEFLKRLEAAEGAIDAKEIYYSLLDDHSLNIEFFLESADYFKRWDKTFAKTVLSNIEEIGYNNVKALRSYAYKLDELGDYENALRVYQRILQLDTTSAQAYLDLANSHRDNANYSEAFSLYLEILANESSEVDFSGILEPLQTELLHIITVHRDKVPYEELPTEWRTASLEIDVRMLFQWNTPQTEFSLQFVNPSKKYFEWFHTIENQKLIDDEIQDGYAIKEFIIQNSEKGIWLINLNKVGNTGLTNPTYLKYTVYTNYGKPNERKSIKVLPIYKNKNKINIDAFKF